MDRHIYVKYKHVRDNFKDKHILLECTFVITSFKKHVHLDDMFVITLFRTKHSVKAYVRDNIVMYINIQFKGTFTMKLFKFYSV